VNVFQNELINKFFSNYENVQILHDHIDNNLIFNINDTSKEVIETRTILEKPLFIDVLTINKINHFGFKIKEILYRILTYFLSSYFLIKCNIEDENILRELDSYIGYQANYLVKNFELIR